MQYAENSRTYVMNESFSRLKRQCVGNGDSGANDY